ncbi:MAG: hypothetical protein KGZ35_05955 [Truepera sp.]|nr:hypothetical protein [Truepera sp.]
MKRLWMLLLLLILASGCTGTVEEIPETLLVVGFANGDQGRLALIENNVLQPEGGLVWLADSLRDLPGLPLAADVIDRAGGRTALVVLSRDGAGLSYLSTFNLRNLAPDRLEGFAETARIALNDLPGPRPTVICPTRLQVSSDGRFAALLHQPAACGAPGNIFISLLELTPPRFVRHYEGRVFPLVDNALVLDQIDDTLYFLEEVTDGVRLERVALAEPTRVSTVSEAVIPAREIQDMGIVLDSMVVLATGSFVAFENYRVPGDAAPPVTTSPGSRSLISSDFADLERVIILGRDHFTVHLSVTDTAQPTAILRDYQSGTVEALNRLVFVAGDRRVAVFDELSYREGTPALTVIPLTDLTAPAFISWFPALVLPP